MWGSWRYWGFTPQPRSEARIVAAATVNAVETTPIRAEISGVVDAVNCAMGATVQAGQVCATIEARALHEELARKESALRRATAEAEKARADAAKAKAAFDRTAAGGTRSAKTLALARKAYERAQARALREDASVTTAAAAANAARSTLERTKLLSPVAGTIVTRAAEVGREVSASGKALFLVASDLGVVKIEARVDASFIRDRRLGDTVVFAVDEFPGRLFQGKIIELSQPPEAGSAENSRLVLLTKNDARLLQPGNSVKIHLGQSMVGP